MGFEKHLHLHTIIMLRDLIRKWWQCELGFADRDGVVAEWDAGKITPPPNDFCRLSLFSPEGLKRCAQSVRVLATRFKESPKLRRAQVHECHLGLCVLGAPVYAGGEFAGMIFVEGFLGEPQSEAAAERMKMRTRELNPGQTDLDRAAVRIPVLGARDQERLADMLEWAATDLANFEADQLRVRTVPEGDAQSRLGDRIVGQGAAMREVFRLVEKVAASDATVLVNGESGTGKELIARALHDLGPRRKKPFVAQNCSAFNDNLLESALFGHRRGSFTGALKDKRGLFEEADGGTFFLDEIGDMSPSLQVKLLRVLQEGTFLPVGGNTPREVDVRVVAATHKDLGELVKKGAFREDLYYRVNVIRIQVPPLRDRREDLPLLVDHFLRKHARPETRARGLAPDTRALFQQYHWPGNVRELENELSRLTVLGGDQEWLGADLVSPRIREAVLPPSAGPAPALAYAALGNLNEAVELLERDMIGRGLQRTGNNKSRLARELGISRSNLILKINKFGLDKVAGPDEEPSEEAP
jgi:DNA-binding NtrC family response regulator